MRTRWFPLKSDGKTAAAGCMSAGKKLSLIHISPQAIIDAVSGCGGLAVLAHPAWSLNRPADALRLSGLAGTEIYNSVSGIPWNARPYSGAFVDQLAVEGRLLPCFAADDAHFYNGDATRSYILVKAAEKTSAAILDAIRRGDFYATQGPRFSLTCLLYTSRCV